MHDDDLDLDIKSQLPDLSSFDLALLPALRDSALAQAIRRVLDAAESPEEATLGFQQSI